MKDAAYKEECIAIRKEQKLSALRTRSASFHGSLGVRSRHQAQGRVSPRAELPPIAEQTQTGPDPDDMMVDTPDMGARSVSAPSAMLHAAELHPAPFLESTPPSARKSSFLARVPGDFPVDSPPRLNSPHSPRSPRYMSDYSDDDSPAPRSRAAPRLRDAKKFKSASELFTTPY